jgi:hypothetical protein
LTSFLIVIVKIEIEYTETQGITELWNKVNEATQLEPRVSAVETLVNQQETRLVALDDIPQRVENLENAVDANPLSDVIISSKANKNQ